MVPRTLPCSEDAEVREPLCWVCFAAAPAFPIFDAADSAEVGIDPPRTNIPAASVAIAINNKRFIFILLKIAIILLINIFGPKLTKPAMI
jgi:hypothetical protein